MAKVRYNRTLLEKKIKLDKKTIERINLLGTTVEALNDNELELEIPANRPDLLSMEGFIRAFKAFEGKETGLKQYKRATSKEYSVKVDKSVKSVWPYTVCAVVKNVKLDADELGEIIALQEKLHNTLGRNRKKAGIGIYPLEKIAFPLKYEARKPSDILFTPLGADKPMSGEQIREKHPMGKEYGRVFKDASKYPVFVDAQKRILSMPPIINSEETGRVNEHTHDLFIECSGTDRAILEKILIIITTDLADRGGTVYGVRVHDEKETITPNFEPTRMKIQRQHIEQRIGIALTEKELDKYASRMGHAYKAGTIQIPAWRTDVLHPVDIAEDIAIAYGYDNLVPTMPAVATIGGSSPQTITETRIRDLLNGLDMLELSSLHFITKEEAERADEKKAIEVENPRTEYTHLRPNLMIPLLRTLAANRDAEYPQHLYELGAVFYADNSQESGVAEEQRVIIALTPGNFTKAKEVLDYITRMTNLTYTLKEADITSYVSGRTGSIMINNHAVGHIGEIHPNALRDWKLRMPLAIIELKLEPFLSR